MTTTLTKIEKRIDVLEEQQPDDQEHQMVIFLPDNQRDGPIDYDSYANRHGTVRIYDAEKPAPARTEADP